MNRITDDKGRVPKRPGGGRPPQGKAVDDEDPDHSPMDDRGLAMPTGPAQPYDIDRMESDRMKSQGPAIKSGE